MTKVELEELLDDYERMFDDIREARSMREVRQVIEDFEREEEDDKS